MSKGESVRTEDAFAALSTMVAELVERHGATRQPIRLRYALGDIAQLVGVCTKSARRLVREGKIPAPIDLNAHRWQWFVADIDAWERAGCPLVEVAGEK